jgi:hypothetical protein
MLDAGKIQQRPKVIIYFDGFPNCFSTVANTASAGDRHKRLINDNVPYNLSIVL